MKDGETLPVCKVGYPRPLRSGVSLNHTTGRHEYEAVEPEDQKISPYVPEWLLAWGANMNVQYLTNTAFLSYIAKYVAKPEPSGLVVDTEALRARDRQSTQQNFLLGRCVRAPEIVTTVLGIRLHSPTGCVEVPTDPPSDRRRRVRSSAEQARDRAEGRAPRVYADGKMETYANRPAGDGVLSEDRRWAVNFESMPYGAFWREYDVVLFKNLSKDRPCWRLSGQTGPLEKCTRVVVARAAPVPIRYPPRLPHWHGDAFYYQQLMVHTAWRSPLLSVFTSQTVASGDNPHGSLREECILRGLRGIGADDVENVRTELNRRMFSPGEILRLCSDAKDGFRLADASEIDGHAIDPALHADDDASRARAIALGQLCPAERPPSPTFDRSNGLLWTDPPPATFHLDTK